MGLRCGDLGKRWVEEKSGCCTLPSKEALMEAGESLGSALRVRGSESIRINLYLDLYHRPCDQ